MPWQIVMRFRINILVDVFVRSSFALPFQNDGRCAGFFTVMVKHPYQLSWHFESTFLLRRHWLMSENYVISLAFQNGGNLFGLFRIVTVNRLNYWKINLPSSPLCWVERRGRDFVLCGKPQVRTSIYPLFFQ